MSWYGTDLRYCQSFNDKTFDYDWGKGDYYLSIVSLREAFTSHKKVIIASPRNLLKKVRIVFIPVCLRFFDMNVGRS